MDRVEALVVGGGIVGLATARELLRRRPGTRLVLVEKEQDVGTHQTGHNSGVIHSGIYYRPGSEKARLCVDGAREMVDYCKDRGLPLRVGGKLIVAVDDTDLERLSELERRAKANGVEGVRRLDAAGIREIEPDAAGHTALYCPTTAVTDFAAVARSLRDDVRTLGGEIETGFRVARITPARDGVVVESESGPSRRALTVVACAGAQSDRMAAGVDAGIRIVPFRGSYFDLRPEAAARVRSMIYPVPDPRFPFLGVHFTRHVDGTVSCGPNAVVALAREQYHRRGFQARDAWDVLRFGGFWRLCRRYWRSGAEEVLNDRVVTRVVTAGRRYLPDLTRDDLLPGGTGVRAQAVAGDGTLVDDFVFRRRGPVLHVLNAPSPAATASLAIARRIADELEEAGPG